MQNKKLHTVHVIAENLSKRLSSTDIKINSVLISISNKIDNTLDDLADRLEDDFKAFDRMLNVTLTKMNIDGKLELESYIKSMNGILNKMKVKVFYIRILVEKGDDVGLKVVAKDYIADIKEFSGILKVLKSV